MLVSESNFKVTLNTLLQEKCIGLDTETYGLNWNDKLFSLILSNKYITLYYNFGDAPDHLGAYPPAEYVLDKQYIFSILREALFNHDDFVWFIHNAKYDLQRLSLEGVEVKGRTHCTLTAERLLRNDHLDYSLDGCAKRRQMRKSPVVEEYIAKNKLYDWEEIPGKKTRGKNKKFHLVPFGVMVEYAQQDAKLCYQLGMEQMHALAT